MPGNSTKEQSFYEMQSQPIMPGVEWPGLVELATVEPDQVAPSEPNPSPFKLGGM